MDARRVEVDQIVRRGVRVTGQQDGDVGLGACADEGVAPEEAGQVSRQHRMVGDEQPPCPLRGAGERLSDDRGLARRRVAGLPPPCGHRVEADGDHVRQFDDRIEILGEVALVATRRRQEATRQVDQGKVVVPDDGEDGGGQSIDERPGLLELAAPCPLRQVAGDDDEVGCRECDIVQQGLDEVRAVGAEVEVGEMDDDRHASTIACSRSSDLTPQPGLIAGSSVRSNPAWRRRPRLPIRSGGESAPSRWARSPAADFSP